MVNPEPTGWTVAITDPNSGRVRQPDVLDSPTLNPGPNAQPRLRVPVPKDTSWLSDRYDDDPEMQAWRNGDRVPVEVLRNVEQREDRTVLIGVGGVELEGRARREYNDDRRHIAVRDLVESETGYAVDAPEPEVQTITDQLQRSVDTDAEFADAFSLNASDPFVISGGEFRPAQVAFTTEGEAFDDGQEGFDNTTNSGDYSAGDYFNGTRGEDTTTPGDFAEWEFTPEHDIPADNVGFQVRDGSPTTNAPAFKWRLIFPDGSDYLIDELTSTTAGLSEILNWEDIGDGKYDNLDGYQGPGLTAGEMYTLRLDITDGAGNLDSNQYNVDVVAPYDTRYESALTFDDTNDGSGGPLDGPAYFAPIDALTTSLQSGFDVTAARSELTINDTSGAQRVQISNDGGTTFLPDDGTEQNTDSVTVDSFPNTGSTLRQRFTLGGYEPNGSQSVTPALGYAAQAIDAYDLFADITLELLLINETFDNDIASILTDIAEVAERSWAFTFEDGTPTVTFVANGQRTADFAPEVNTRTREKLGKTYDSVTIKGSNEPVSREPYTAATTFSPLVRENILPGSETVVDPATGENFARGDDYQINYQPGEIRATGAGNLTVGSDYEVNYQYQPRGTFTINDVADPDELVEVVPGVTSERLGEQVAFVIASDVQTPRYAADVSIPDPDPRFDPTEALPPGALGLPTVASPLEVRSDPELTERGLRVRFGTRPAVEDSIQRLSRQLSRVSDRS